MINFDNFIKYFKEYTNEFSPLGIAFLATDIILLLILIIFIIKVLKIKLKAKKVFWFILAVALIYGVTYFCSFNITFTVLKIIAFWSIGILVILYSQEIKHNLEVGLHNATNSSVYSSDEEKMNVVNMIVSSAKFLSERKIGALICIERADSLDVFIEKAISIKGNITQELLTSLFFVETPTHDGAVIIRKNSIMCAGAYLPSTDRYDIPKELGTRHRAAIGLSEKFDAVTVVVSEESRKISLTIGGEIIQNLTPDKLREMLLQYLLRK